MHVQNPQIFTFQSRKKVSGCLNSRLLLCLPFPWHTSTMFHIHIQCLVNLKLKFWIKSCCLIWIHVHKQALCMSNITVHHASLFITVISIKIHSRLYMKADTGSLSLAVIRPLTWVGAGHAHSLPQRQVGRGFHVHVLLLLVTDIWYHHAEFFLFLYI